MTSEAANRLRHVRWIGGAPGAGKSTVAAALARRLDIPVYSTDESLAEHVRRATPDAQPLVHAFLGMDMDTRWANRTPSEMLATFHGFRGEMFEFIVADLLALSDDQPIVVEGFRILPRQVAPLLTQQLQAVWLLPTPAFRRAAFKARGSTYDIAGKTSDPERALKNVSARDKLFTDELARDTAALNLPVITVETSLTLESVVDAVGEALGLS